MKASIVICSYNQGRYIGETLESITSQRGLAPGELEIILVDGQSTDDTVDVIAQYRDKLDVVVVEPDRGQSDALRKGFDLATGEILGWLCSDDVIEPTAIREVIDYFQTHSEARFIYGDAMFIDKAGGVIDIKREIDWNWFVWLHDHNFIRQPSAFWRKELYNLVGGIDPDLQISMDADLFCRFALITVPRHVESIWSRLRMYPEIKTLRMREAHRAERLRILDRCGAGHRWKLQRATYFAVAKVLRTYLKLKQRRYGESPMSQVASLLSKRRWLQLFGVWK
jgi:glycosyltransferase involved in cell wall biosynthesis